jgi:copper chaperone
MATATYTVSGMTCGHCVNSISRAVHGVDASARIEVDLARRLVHIEPADADLRVLSDAIAEAGYHPVPLIAAREGIPARAGGCCCGTGASPHRG